MFRTQATKTGKVELNENKAVAGAVSRSLSMGAYVGFHDENIEIVEGSSGDDEDSQAEDAHAGLSEGKAKSPRSRRESQGSSRSFLELLSPGPLLDFAEPVSVLIQLVLSWVLLQTCSLTPHLASRDLLVLQALPLDPSRRFSLQVPPLRERPQAQVPSPQELLAVTVCPSHHHLLGHSPHLGLQPLQTVAALVPVLLERTERYSVLRYVLLSGGLCHV